MNIHQIREKWRGEKIKPAKKQPYKKEAQQRCTLHTSAKVRSSPRRWRILKIEIIREKLRINWKHWRYFSRSSLCRVFFVGVYAIATWKPNVLFFNLADFVSFFLLPSSLRSLFRVIFQTIQPTTNEEEALLIGKYLLKMHVYEVFFSFSVLRFLVFLSLKACRCHSASCRKPASNWNFRRNDAASFEYLPRA